MCSTRIRTTPRTLRRLAASLWLYRWRDRELIDRARCRRLHPAIHRVGVWSVFPSPAVREINPTLWLSSRCADRDGARVPAGEQFVQLDDATARPAPPSSSAANRVRQLVLSALQLRVEPSGQRVVRAGRAVRPGQPGLRVDVAVSSHGGDWLATLSRANGPTWCGRPPTACLVGVEPLESPSTIVRAGLLRGGRLGADPSRRVRPSHGRDAGTFSSTDGTTWSPIDLGADTYAGELALVTGSWQ